jgi:hypothetical protein
MEPAQRSLYDIEEPTRGSRQRRVIIMLTSEEFSQIEAIALFGGFASIEEYTKSAVQDRFKEDQQKCRAAIGRAETNGGQAGRRRKG